MRAKTLSSFSKKKQNQRLADKILYIRGILEAQPVKALEAVSLLLKEYENNVELIVLSGRLHRIINKYHDAEVFYNRALSIQPMYVDAINAKTSMLYSQERFDELDEFLSAIIPLLSKEKSVVLRPIQAMVYQKKKKYIKSISLFKDLIDESDENWHYYNQLGLIYQDLAEFDKMNSMYEASKLHCGMEPLPYFNQIVGAHYNPAMSIDDINILCRDWQGVIKNEGGYGRAKAKDLTKGRKIRIGMISDGFRSHPVGNMITLGLWNVSEVEIEMYFYSTNSYSDHVTTKIKRIAKEWKVIEDFSTDEVENIIRNDKVDILFDLNGYNANSQMLVFQREPAPIMVKWVGGLISSTNLVAMDYLLSDSVETPYGVDSLYTEKLIRLPVDYICYDPPSYIPQFGLPPMIANGFVTFGCFNNAAKISNELLAEWAILLNDVTDSRLFLKSFNFSDASLCERVYSTLESHGVARERVILEGASPHKDLFESYNRVDIALDSWPYSGGLTTCEAMVMGVPVVTLPGPTFAGRHSASHLVHAGMPELVAENWNHYREIASGLANDKQNLGLIRQHLREILLSSPVCNGEIFALHFTDAMRAIWQRYCEGKSPEALSFNEQGELYFAHENEAVVLERASSHSEITELEKNIADFSFNLAGKVQMIDYGGAFARSQHFKEHMSLNGTFAIIFDPLGVVEDHFLPLRRNALQRIQMQLLGNGEEKSLFICLDPKFSSDLPAIHASTNIDIWHPQKVLATLTAPSIKLDEIHGLNSIDWLVLDNKFDLKSLFDFGKRVISSCLLVAVHVRFEVTHKNQLSLSEIFKNINEMGFDFHSFYDIEYLAPVETEGDTVLPSSQMVSAQALFVVNAQRRAALTQPQRETLAFIYHAGYHLNDMTFKLLVDESKDRAYKYLRHFNSDSKPVDENLL